MNNSFEEAINFKLNKYQKKGLKQLGVCLIFAIGFYSIDYTKLSIPGKITFFIVVFCLIPLIITGIKNFRKEEIPITPEDIAKIENNEKIFKEDD